ncbi:hypothetical protein N7676_05685 [Stenotrophomonas sp. GD03993]|uniref:hypothetical protein n=1 Tax=Stenotrophomonas TaxID=40323 RepID=UPI00244CBE9D|nr:MULTISPECIES: hypothetical protein [Stenotrophomonas]MDH0187579.1 hypothetical protein [Stenotrophomonas sp. GD04051]MDH0463291.1 hypothetical protein [Stenotrophomonas sp. GD03993]MDH0876160.1 hypothetical protein [Stenotrophomonas sp. GD03877]
MLALGILAMQMPTVVAAEPPRSTVEVGYSASLDLFNLLDNLPDWLPGYTSLAYQKAWERRFGLDDRDRRLLAAYAAFRQRTSLVAQDHEATAAPADRLFAGADTRDGDPYASHFLDAASFDIAAEAAIALQNHSDQVLLRQYYARFVPRARQLLAGRKPFSAQQAALDRQLKSVRVDELAGQMKTFFGVDAPPTFQVRFLWWPEAAQTQAKLRGGYIFLFSTFDAEEDWAPIVMHEYSHFLSVGQPSKQRRALAEAFAGLCPAALTLRNPLNALEEPLAIYWGQYRFERLVRDGTLSAASSWYIQPHADRAAKAIAAAFPATAPAPRLEAGPLLSAAASVCAGATPE